MGAQPTKASELPSISAVPIDLNYFNTTWYEIGRYNGPWKFEAGCKGATAVYNDLKDPKNPEEEVTELKPGLTFKVTNSCIQNGTYSNQIKNALGRAEILGEGKVLVSFPQIPKFVIDDLRKKGQPNYIVIEYDSGNYSVVTSPKFDYLWILSPMSDFSTSEKFQELKEKYTNDIRFNKKQPGIKGKTFLVFTAEDYKNL